MKRFGRAKGDKLIPYQFGVPASTHAKVTGRFEEAGIPIAPLMRMYFHKLRTADIDKLIVSLGKFNKRQSRSRKKNNKRG